MKGNGNGRLSKMYIVKQFDPAEVRIQYVLFHNSNLMTCATPAPFVPLFSAVQAPDLSGLFEEHRS